MKLTQEKTHSEEFYFFFVENKIVTTSRNGSGEKVMIEKRVVWECGEEFGVATDKV